jgi:hypothetical protein
MDIRNLSPCTSNLLRSLPGVTIPAFKRVWAPFAAAFSWIA